MFYCCKVVKQTCQSTEYRWRVTWNSVCSPVQLEKYCLIMLKKSNIFVLWLKHLAQLTFYVRNLNFNQISSILTFNTLLVEVLFISVKIGFTVHLIKYVLLLVLFCSMLGYEQFFNTRKTGLTILYNVMQNLKKSENQLLYLRDC